MADRLRGLRLARSYSRDAIADAIGIGRSTLSEWEAGTPRALEHLARLAERYEVSADYLLGLTDDPRPAGRGSALPARSSEMIEILRRLGPAQSERLLYMAQGLLAHQEERRRLTRERIEVGDALAERYGPERAALLEDLAVEAVAAGLPDAAILRLLGLAAGEEAPQE